MVGGAFVYELSNGGLATAVRAETAKQRTMGRGNCSRSVENISWFNAREGDRQTKIHARNKPSGPKGGIPWGLWAEEGFRRRQQAGMEDCLRPPRRRRAGD